MRTVDPEQQAERREQILDAAVKAFAREGFHKASMTDIAAAAGMSAGNLYRYFKSKETIVRALAERERSDSHKLIAALTEAPDLVEAVAQTCAETVKNAGSDETTVHLEIAAEMARNPELAAVFLELERGVQEQFAAAIATAQRKGQVTRSIAAKAAARLLINISYALAYDPMLPPNERRALAKEARRMIRGYLRPSEEA